MLGLSGGSRQGRPALRTVMAAAVLVLCAASGLAVSTTGAFFTAGTSSSGAFSAGTVQLSAAPASAAMTMDALSPGDVRYGRLSVQNAGTLALRYAIASTATDDAATVGDDRDLAAALQVALRVIPTGSTCDASSYPASTNPVATRANPQALSAAVELALVGDKAQGAQTGDRVLAPSAAETLCFQVGLPASAPDALQGLRTTVSLRFYAEQTVRNP